MSLPPGYPHGFPPVAPERPKRRWWLIGIVAAWAVLLAGFALWSVRNDPPTVPEQRNIAEALPTVQQAFGAVVAAADGADRTITLGELRFDRDCALTPVREGVEALRDVTVRVQPDQAPAALEAIARALPTGYAAATRRNQAGTKYALRADAGGFVSIEAGSAADATVLTVKVATGCRPTAGGVDLAPTPAAASETPAAFAAAVRKLGGSPAGATASEVNCPAGGTARTVTADGLQAPADLGSALQELIAGAVVVQTDPHAWAWRAGKVSVVVVDTDGQARVSATTGCA